VLLILAAARLVQAGEAPAEITADTLWSAADNPWTVAQQCVVAEGVTLTIEPGARIELGAEATLTVKGRLVARGTEADKIRFVGLEIDGKTSRWGSLRFEPTADGATFENVDDWTGGSILEECSFEGGSRALVLDGASPYVHACDFLDNQSPMTLDLDGGGAMHVLNGSTARIRDCHFEGNSAQGFGRGGAVYVDSANPIIQDNVFLDNVSIYGGALCTNLMASPIVGNTFTNNRAEGSEYSEGGGASLVSTISAVLNNLFDGNQSLADGGGLHVCVGCHPHATPFIMDNTVTGNATAAADPAHGAGGIGAGYLRTMTGNNIHGNTRAGAPSEFGWFHPLADGFAEWVSHKSIAGNWWGTTDEDAIAGLITDGNDLEGLGTVDYLPVLDGPVAGPTPRVTLTTRRQVYDVAGYDMPVFLTLYNPGPEKSFELRVHVRYDGLPPVPYVLPLGLPSEQRELGMYRFAAPGNSVSFHVLATPTYDPERNLSTHGWWSATLFDAETGAAVGETCSIRFDLLGQPREGRP
jgi:hypothetical protein